MSSTDANHNLRPGDRRVIVFLIIPHSFPAHLRLRVFGGVMQRGANHAPDPTKKHERHRLMIVGVPTLGEATYVAFKNGLWAGQGLLCPAQRLIT
jgi:hypothetical protein